MKSKNFETGILRVIPYTGYIVFVYHLYSLYLQLRTSSCMFDILGCLMTALFTLAINRHTLFTLHTHHYYQHMLKQPLLLPQL